MSTVPEQPLHATPATPNQAPLSEIDPYSDEGIIHLECVSGAARPWNRGMADAISHVRACAVCKRDTGAEEREHVLVGVRRDDERGHELSSSRQHTLQRRH